MPNRHPPSVAEVSPPPRPWQRVLIHLAGATPDYFRFISPHNTNDYVKLGLSVLVPFGLAYFAGSSTAMTLQEDPKSQIVSSIVGVCWALVILIVDVTVMTLMVKTRPLRPLPPQPSTEHGYQRPMEPQPEAAPVEPDPSLSSRRLPALRITIALVLGMFMSHTLVLMVFKNRVLQMAQMNRAKLADGVESEEQAAAAKQRELDTMLSVQSITDPDAFLHAFRKLSKANDQTSEQGDPETTHENSFAVSPYAEDKGIMKLQEIFDKTVEDQKIEVARREGQIEFKQRSLDILERDLQNAEFLLKDEYSGENKRTYEFKTTDFLTTLSSRASGIGGKRDRYAFIKTFIDQQTAIKDSLDKELQAQREEVAQLRISGKTVLDEKQKELSAAKKLFEESKSQAVKDAIVQRSTRAADARAALQERAESLRREVNQMHTIVAVHRRPLETSSYDILEETEALFDIAMGKGVDTSILRRIIMIGLIFLVLATFMVVDLSPLLMKLFTPPSEYDDFVQRLRRSREVTAPVLPSLPDAHGTSATATLIAQAAPAPAPSGRRLPPPPPPSSGYSH